MLDIELIDLFATALESASASGGYNYKVIQTSAPTQQGIPTEPMINFQKLFDMPMGWPKEQLDYDEPNDQFISRSIQEVSSKFQVSALVIQDPSNTTLPTASDVVNYLYNYLHSRYNVSIFIKEGANILRAPNIGNPYFEDDRSRFEARPSFDIDVTHAREIRFIIPAVHVVEGDAFEV